MVSAGWGDVGGPGDGVAAEGQVTQCGQGGVEDRVVSAAVLLPAVPARSVAARNSSALSRSASCSPRPEPVTQLRSPATDVQNFIAVASVAARRTRFLC